MLPILKKAKNLEVDEYESYRSAYTSHLELLRVAAKLSDEDLKKIYNSSREEIINTIDTLSCELLQLDELQGFKTPPQSPKKEHKTPKQTPTSPPEFQQLDIPFPETKLSLDCFSPKGQALLKEALKQDELDDGIISAFTKLIIYSEQIVSFDLDYFGLKTEEILHVYNNMAVDHNLTRGESIESVLREALKEALSRVINTQKYRLYIDDGIVYKDDRFEAWNQSQQQDIIIASSKLEVKSRDINKAYWPSISRATIQVKRCIQARDVTKAIENLGTTPNNVLKFVFGVETGNFSRKTATNLNTIQGSWLNQLKPVVDGLFILRNKHTLLSKSTKQPFGYIALKNRVSFAKEISDAIDRNNSDWTWVTLTVMSDVMDGIILATLFVISLESIPVEHRNAIELQPLKNAIKSFQWTKLT